MKPELSPSQIITGGIAIATKNFVSLVINSVLFLLTFWIPWLNVGTFIGISSGVILKMSKGKSVSATEIFDPEYRKYFGEYFFQIGVKYVAVNLAFAFMVIPGIILGITWWLSELLFLDGRSKPGVDAFRDSNEYTYGYKMTIFLSQIVFILGIIILIWIGNAISPFVGGLFMLVAFVGVMPILMGMQAYIYQKLVLEEDDMMDDLGMDGGEESVEEILPEDF